MTNPLSLNLYTYVLNNPLIYIDPSGHDVAWASAGWKDPYTPTVNRYSGTGIGDLRAFDEQSSVSINTNTAQKSQETGNIVQMGIDTKSPPPKETGYKPPKNPDKAKRRVPAPGGEG